MNKVRITAAIASATSITLYKDNGDTFVVKSDSFRTRAIMDDVLPLIAQRKVAEIDLDAYSLEKEIEKKSGGVLRFVKIAGDAVKKLFAKQKINHGSNSNESYRVDVPKETTVAIVNGRKIPGAEKLEKIMENAVATDNVAGLQRFMERIATVINKRGHSVQELMTFLQHADLPIAEDGSIIAYKILRRAPNERYVDCHSGLVSQTVGSRVSMDEKLVNADRRVECATGLHIARRGYINGFPGDVVVAVKVAPEDVIAVPRNEPNKMRAAAYHIVWELPPAAYTLLRSNKPMTSDEASAKILANIIAGNHIGVTENVVIAGPKGQNVTITKIGEEKSEPVVISMLETKAQALDDTATTPVITPREINQRTDATLRAAAASGDLSAAISKPVVKPAKAAKPKAVVQEQAVSPEPKPITQMVDDEIAARDKKVMDLIAQGHTQQFVADQTGVGYRTVRRIVARHKA